MEAVVVWALRYDWFVQSVPWSWSVGVGVPVALPLKLSFLYATQGFHPEWNLHCLSSVFLLPRKCSIFRSWRSCLLQPISYWTKGWLIDSSLSEWLYRYFGFGSSTGCSMRYYMRIRFPWYRMCIGILKWSRYFFSHSFLGTREEMEALSGCS